MENELTGSSGPGVTDKRAERAERHDPDFLEPFNVWHVPIQLGYPAGLPTLDRLKRCRL